jgi:serine/threonine-protein kinase PknG
MAAEFVSALPVPNVDPTDPAAGFLANLVAADPTSLITALTAAPVRTVSVSLRLARAKIALGDFTGAADELETVEALATDDWRLFWYRAILALAAVDLVTAGAGFETVYDLLPGEARPSWPSPRAPNSPAGTPSPPATTTPYGARITRTSGQRSASRG